MRTIGARLKLIFEEGMYVALLIFLLVEWIDGSITIEIFLLVEWIDGSITIYD